MGNRVSTRGCRTKSGGNESEEKSDERDSEATPGVHESKILLLGASQSGKSTIFKQAKIIHQSGFSKDELATWRSVVYQNLLYSAQAIVLAMRKYDLSCELSENQQNIDKISNYNIDSSSSFVFSEAVAQAIHDVWKDPIIIKVMDHSNEFMDNTSYFFSEALRIGQPNYLPTAADILRAQQKTTGIIDTRLEMGSVPIHLYDVAGGRSERQRWVECFDGVTGIMYCASLSEYDEVLSEDPTQNRMVESLELFDSLINSQWFLRSTIILFLNKLDVFEAKVPKVALEKYFPEYTGGPNVDAAKKFVMEKYVKANRTQLKVYTHFTEATNTSNIRLVFAGVKETILQNLLKQTRIL